MIKINLLPYRQQRKKQLLKQQLAIGVIPLVLTIIGVVIAWWSISSTISSAEQQIVHLKQEIEKQKVTLKEIEAYKSKKETIKQKMNVIQTLQKGKTGPVHMLDDLAANLPGRLWLAEVKQTEMFLEIKGRAMDNISISNYMVNLEKSSYFANVDLKEIKTDSKHSAKGLQLKDFVITSNLSYGTEIKAEAKAEAKPEKKPRPKPAGKPEDEI